MTPSTVSQPSRAAHLGHRADLGASGPAVTAALRRIWREAGEPTTGWVFPAPMDLGDWTEGRVLDEIYSHTTDRHRAEVMAWAGIGCESTGALRDRHGKAKNLPVGCTMPAGHHGLPRHLSDEDKGPAGPAPGRRAGLQIGSP